MNPILSIIVPVYNVKQYLCECVDSILSQNFYDIELILVDDGSTDGSGDICDEYEKKDDRIKVIHKKNGGLSSSRNVGLDIAAGKYITFVDSDDYIAQDSYSYNIKILENNSNIEILQFPTNKLIEGGGIQNLYFHSNLLIDNNAEIFSMWYNGKKAINYCCWNKIYKASIIKNIRFPLNKLFEDIYFNSYLMPKVKSFYLSEFGCYIYRIRKNSITNGNYSSKLFYNAVEPRLNIYIKSLNYNNIDLAERIDFYLENIKMLYIAKKLYNDKYISEIENKYFANRPKFQHIIQYKGTIKNKLLLLMISLLGKNLFGDLYCKILKI